MAKLRPNLERFFNFISTKNEGDTVTDQDLLAAAGWEPATLRTHRDKNAFGSFLATLNPGTFENVKHRFSGEARNGPKLAHDNLVAYIDMGDYQGHPFLVMELADESLASKIAVKLLSVAESVGVVECCALGLLHLHEKDCVHRDVKPHNILRFGSRFVLGDLGIVNWSDMNPAFTSAGTITKDSLQLGSWYYMAPEQRSSPHGATPMSDVYALGVSWYEMLTGNTPDPAAIGAQMFPDPCHNADVNSVIRRMLRFDANERPTVADVLALLKTLRPA